MASTTETNLLEYSNDHTSQTNRGSVRVEKVKKIVKRLEKKTYLKKGASDKPSFNCSLWTLDENRAYMDFIIANSQLFELTKIERRDIKINVLMSKAVKTRSPDQCRSHHQKMIKYHSNVMTIISHIANLKQNLEQNHAVPTLQSYSPVGLQLRDFTYEEQQLQYESYCQQLMNADLSYL